MAVAAAHLLLPAVAEAAAAVTYELTRLHLPQVLEYPSLLVLAELVVLLVRLEQKAVPPPLDTGR